MNSNDEKKQAIEGMVRVLFHLASEPQSWHGSVTERLWATPLKDGTYRLENTPFFVFGVSFEDIICAENRSDNLEFVKVAARGGHSTYRILPAKNWAQLFVLKWQELASLGCTYEEGSASLLAADVPPTADINVVYRILEEGERSEIWSFEEGHCGHQTVKED
jgi:hypothetical protein